MGEGIPNIIQFDFSRGEKWRLFRVVVNVGPIESCQLSSPGEPAVLALWLFANSFEDAATRARAIISQLPFQMLDDEVTAFEANESPRERPDFLQHESIARRAGFSFILANVLQP